MSELVAGLAVIEYRGSLASFVQSGRFTIRWHWHIRLLTSFVASRLVIRQDNQQEIIALIIVFFSLIRAELAAIRELLKRQDKANGPEG